MHLRRRGVEARFVLSSNAAPEKPDAKLIRMISRAHRWRRLLSDGAYTKLSELAAAEGVARTDLSGQLPLAFLAPDIVDAILDGRQPTDLTANRIKQALPLPLDWAKQRQVLGF